MKSSLLIAFMATAMALGVALPAHAQNSAVPEALPYDTPYGASITLAQARKIADAAEAESRRRNWKHAIVVVDPAGELVYFQKMDNTQFASVQIAIDKAKTAARMRRPTKVIQEGVLNGGTATITLHNVTAVEGGLPLILDGHVIGAIGVSGGTGGQDSIVAESGVSSLTR